MTNLTAEQKRIASDFSSFISLQHPVAMAVEPLREKVLARAAKDAQGVIDRVQANMEAAGWDLLVAAPRANSRTDNRATYIAKNSKNSLYSRLTVSAPGCRSFQDKTDIRTGMDADQAAKFIVEAQKMTALAYDAFIVKLCKKIGTCETAALEGEHVWGRSTLTVSKGGTTERWLTQQILNYSVLGLPYNQWPSRKVK